VDLRLLQLDHRAAGIGQLIGTLGWALAFRSAVGVLLTGLLVPPLIARIRAEEALLSAEFGEAYSAYRARTARLIPGLSQLIPGLYRRP
jgi:protein-S-isoprenylcysteine O-methyltransferase Ste14